MESPVHVQEEDSPLQKDYENSCEQPPTATPHLVRKFTVMDADTAVVLETGGAANCVCFMMLGRRNSIVERWGVPCAETYPARTLRI